MALIVLGDGQQRDDVVRRGGELLGGRFLFQGFLNQTELARYYGAADTFVLPSQYEAWGLVVNEAMQLGLPAILSDMVGCHEDLLQEGDTGHLFRSGDAQDLANQMQTMMADPAGARRMGKAASHLVSQYSTEASARGIEAAIAASS